MKLPHFTPAVLTLLATASAVSATVEYILLDLQACPGKKFNAVPVAYIVGTKPAQYVPWYGVKYGLFNISVPLVAADNITLRIWLTDEKRNPGTSLGLDHPYTVFNIPQRTTYIPATTYGRDPKGFNDETATEPVPFDSAFFHKGLDPWKDQDPTTVAHSSGDPYSFGAITYCREFGDGL